jgi:hypothetical protein
MIKLTNVDFIILYLYARKGRARRCDIMRAASEWRKAQGKDPLQPIYFSRWKRQSPYYVYDHVNSVHKRSASGFYRGAGQPDAKVSMWKLTPSGTVRAQRLHQTLVSGLVQSICS